MIIDVKDFVDDERNLYENLCCFASAFDKVCL